MLRAAAQAIPLPPVEPLLEKWKQANAPAKPAQVVSLADFTAADALAFAARSGTAISAETRARLAQLVREMTGPNPPGDGR